MKKIEIGIAVGAAIAILALVACLVPLKAVAYTVTVEYEATETYYEDEPYEDTETYYEDEPYEDTETYYERVPYKVTETYYENVPVMMEILEHRLVRDFLLFVRGKVKHTGDQTMASIDVTIWVEYQVEGLGDRIFRQPGGIGLNPPTFKPGEVRDFEVLVQDATTNYEILAPATGEYRQVERERTVTKYRQVEKQRTVTKYRQVERQRTVTKYRQVGKERIVTKQCRESRYKKVSLLDYLLHY